MPSPFPGMDPWLEDPEYWSGFHTTFMVHVRAAITHVLPAGYFAEVEQYVWLQGEDPEHREPFAVPDSHVAHRGNGVTAVATKVASDPSTEVTLPRSGKRKGRKFVQIVDRRGHRIVTVIELLTPSNKDPGPDRNAYLAKRDEYLASGTNLIEIDLLREGDRHPFGRPKPPPADYYALVCWADRFPKASVWAFTVRDPMPVLPIPLKRADGEVALDLRACLDRTFEDAGYETRLNYGELPSVRLRTPDAEWAAELLKKRSVARSKDSP